MIESIEIENLRGIAHGKLEGLTPLTILVGPNGSGKSTILDAVYLNASPTPGISLQDVIARQGSIPDQERWLIHLPHLNHRAHIKLYYAPTKWTDSVLQTDTRNHVFIKYNISAKIKKNIEIHKTEYYPGEKERFPLPEVFDMTVLLDKYLRNDSSSGIANIYSNAISRGYRSEIIDQFKTVFPGTEYIEILVEQDEPVVHLVQSKYSIPIAIAGDGIYALFRMSLNLSLPSNSLACIEEPEVHLHPALIRQSAQIIITAIRRGIQVILTTHSLELIDALLDAATEPDDLDKLSIFRVKLRDGELLSSCTQGADIIFARHDIGEDLR